MLKCLLTIIGIFMVILAVVGIFAVLGSPTGFIIFEKNIPNLSTTEETVNLCKDICVDKGAFLNLKCNENGCVCVCADFSQTPR